MALSLVQFKPVVDISWNLGLNGASVDLVVIYRDVAMYMEWRANTDATSYKNKNKAFFLNIYLGDIYGSSRWKDIWAQLFWALAFNIVLSILRH